MSLFAETIQSLHQSTDGFRGLLKHLSLDVIEDILKKSGDATIRRRKLPGEMVVWLVIAMALFRNKSLHQIAIDLNLCIGGVPTAGALCDARNRVHSEVIKNLTVTLGKNWANDIEGGKWNGLKTFGIDGTVLNVFDSIENEKDFGRPGGDKDKDQSCYPQVRLVGLLDLHSMMVMDGEMTAISVGENKAAKLLIERIPGDSVTILDRGFQSNLSFFLFSNRGNNCHFVTRLKSTFKATFVRALSPSSYLVKLVLSKEQRQQNPELPRQITARIVEYKLEEKKETYRVLTSLVDPKKYPDIEIAKLYHLRWRFEVALRDIKMTLLDDHVVLRSKSPEKVVQEFWAILLAYNLIRREMSVAAAKNKADPSCMSFKSAMLQLHAFFISHTSSLSAPAKIPAAIEALHEALWLLRLPKARPKRFCPRWVKRKQKSSKFPKKPPRVASEALGA